MRLESSQHNHLPIIKAVRGDRGSVTLCPFACKFYRRPSKAILSTPSFGLCRIWDKTGQIQEKLLVSNIWLFYSFHRLFIKRGKYNNDNDLSIFQIKQLIHKTALFRTTRLMPVFSFKEGVFEKFYQKGYSYSHLCSFITGIYGPNFEN